MDVVDQPPSDQTGAMPAFDVALDPVITRFLALGTNANTRRAYGNAVADFARFVGKPVSAALRQLLVLDAAAAASTVREYKDALIARGAASATINLRLGRLRVLVEDACAAGLVSWKLEVDAVRSAFQRGQESVSRGTCSDALRAITGDSAIAVRDRAIVALLYELALRRSELLMLDVDHIDLQRLTVSVKTPSNPARELRRISPETAGILRRWINSRGAANGPLFVALDRASDHGRLSGKSLTEIVQARVQLVGKEVGPRGLRQSAMAHAIESLWVNLVSAEEMSSERGPRTVLVLDAPVSTTGGSNGDGGSKGEGPPGPLTRFPAEREP